VRSFSIGKESSRRSPSVTTNAQHTPRAYTNYQMSEQDVNPIRKHTYGDADARKYLQEDAAVRSGAKGWTTIHVLAGGIECKKCTDAVKQLILRNEKPPYSHTIAV
jgi:hypothetical protein